MSYLVQVRALGLKKLLGDRVVASIHPSSNKKVDTKVEDRVVACVHHHSINNN